MNDYWVTESNTWKIYANTEAEAREIWNKFCNGTPAAQLDMKLKDITVDADWGEEI
jgi:hypothetical protein